MDGSDFVFAGAALHLKKIAEHMGKNIKVKNIVADPTSGDTLRVTNRGMTWTGHGLIYKSDHRHAGKWIDDMGLSSNQDAVTLMQ